MRNYAKETAARVEYIRAYLRESGARGIVFGNSGGKDSALVGILCKLACEDTVGIIMPCASKRNYGMDRDDGIEVAEKFHIETRTVDLTPVREAELAALAGVTELTEMAVANIAPRLRMLTLSALPTTPTSVSWAASTCSCWAWATTATSASTNPPTSSWAPLMWWSWLRAPSTPTSVSSPLRLMCPVIL